jgi:thiamine biosynthesis protein ThiS
LKIIVNGEQREIESGTTLASLIKSLDLGAVRVAVERNFEIVPRAQHEATALAEGDRLEIVTFVGGG